MISRIVIAIGILALLLGWAIDARAHEPYTEWKQPDNPSVSCCSGQDCRPTKADLRPDGWYVPGDDGKWIPVPWSKVLPTDLAHDGRSHVCRNGTYIYCFSPAEVKG